MEKAAYVDTNKLYIFGRPDNPYLFSYKEISMKMYHIPSETKPNKIYVIRHLDDGSWKCGCMDFLVREKHKVVCKHCLLAIKQEEEDEKRNQDEN